MKPIGTTYEIKSIKQISGHTYLGLKVGETLFGTINQTTYINLIFNTLLKHNKLQILHLKLIILS